MIPDGFGFSSQVDWTKVPLTRGFLLTHFSQDTLKEDSLQALFTVNIDHGNIVKTKTGGRKGCVGLLSLLAVQGAGK